MAVRGEELGLLSSTEVGLQLHGPEAGHWGCYLSLIFSNGISKFDYLIPSRLQQSRNLGYNLRVGVSGAPGTYSPRRACEELFGTVWGWGSLVLRAHTGDSY